MKSSTNKSFRDRLQKLPPEIQELARKNFRLWLQDPSHPSLQFKKVGRLWSVRVGRHYRAVAELVGERFVWFWIGPHDEYELIIADR